MGDCYKICNKKYSTFDPKRTFCKKGCDSEEEDLQKCKTEDCASKCIKAELGDDNQQLGGWSKFFARAPTDPTECLNACYFGCNNRADGDDDD
mmetsp:Transcript_3823/g.3270  ORF Transcript_3823/g.3270 Transcript_3823/m.3270 type:complete len:93 (+) Transcript_3823:40-318(+)|eukprot:CAMPEP_0114590438 /NCGR_PEP_ID=MMETSP0125-20121206/12702_1 /TAXON_ID=485358 ORGANISM="Aristerostoma sp., Strain ATCC 50986" /NCGR_SAMPLE_ID=MMETSP0125 /ASSEMBLY_ACC=CAM_ASM_000245 /LENGTH=92 /DNA_ID=CAMNT_0001787957 /DNA_START=40 /DNA_END=318 /DNA_ORIENTATION=-